MKTRALSIILVSSVLLGAGAVHSQAPGQPVTVGELLGLVRQDNAVLLQRQTKSMQTLDAMQKEAEQIKILAKRG